MVAMVLSFVTGGAGLVFLQPVVRLIIQQMASIVIIVTFFISVKLSSSIGQLQINSHAKIANDIFKSVKFVYYLTYTTILTNQTKMSDFNLINGEILNLVYRDLRKLKKKINLLPVIK